MSSDQRACQQLNPMPNIRVSQWRQLSAALMGLLALLAASPSHATNLWPNGARAAVVLTYDDALESQLANVVPALDAANFKATFFLSGLQQKDVDRWRDVAARVRQRMGRIPLSRRRRRLPSSFRRRSPRLHRLAVEAPPGSLGDHAAASARLGGRPG